MKLIYRCFCLVLGAILGSGCSDLTEPAEYGPGPMPEYGVPTGTIRIAGRVIDEQGEPVPGAQVTFSYGDADTTDAAGNWSINQDNAYIPCANNDDNDCLIEAEDIDGPANGGPYPSVQVVLDLVQTESSSGSWDLGTWEQDGINVVLKDRKKEPSPDEDNS